MAKRKAARDTGDGRVALPIALNPETNRLINEWCDRTGGSKTRFVQTLCEWYAAAPESMQAVIFGQVPRDMLPQYIERAGEWFEGMVRDAAGGPASQPGPASADRSSPSGTRAATPGPKPVRTTGRLGVIRPGGRVTIEQDAEPG